MARKYEYHIHLKGISKTSGKETVKDIYPLLDHPLSKTDLLSFAEKERETDPNFIWTIPFHALLTTHITYEFHYKAYFGGESDGHVDFVLDHEITPQTQERDYINIGDKIEDEILNNPREPLADCKVISHVEIY